MTPVRMDARRTAYEIRFGQELRLPVEHGEERMTRSPRNFVAAS
jgi:hypothetical protein